MLIGLVLVIRFLSELLLLGAFLAWGNDRDGAAWLSLGIAAAVAVAMTWGRWISPKAPRRLPDPLRYLVEAVLFVLGGLAAWPVWGAVPAVIGVTVALGTAWAARGADA